MYRASKMHLRINAHTPCTPSAWTSDRLAVEQHMLYLQGLASMLASARVFFAHHQSLANRRLRTCMPSLPQHHHQVQCSHTRGARAARSHHGPAASQCGRRRLARSACAHVSRHWLARVALAVLGIAPGCAPPCGSGRHERERIAGVLGQT